MSTVTYTLHKPREIQLQGWSLTCPVCGQTFKSESMGRLKANMGVHIESQHPEHAAEIFSPKPPRAKAKRRGSTERGKDSRSRLRRSKHKRAGSLASTPHPQEPKVTAPAPFS